MLWGGLSIALWLFRHKGNLATNHAWMNAESRLESVNFNLRKKKTYSVQLFILDKVVGCSDKTSTKLRIEVGHVSGHGAWGDGTTMGLSTSLVCRLIGLMPPCYPLLFTVPRWAAYLPYAPLLLHSYSNRMIIQTPLMLCYPLLVRLTCS